MPTLITDKPITIQSLSGTEEIVKVDDNTAIKYSVHEERIDLGALETEKLEIEARLSRVLNDDKLLEWAKANYFLGAVDIEKLQARLEEINMILSLKGGE